MDKTKSSKVIATGETSKNTTINSTSSSLRHTRRVLENFPLVWLDAKYDETRQSFSNLRRALRSIVASVNIFTDPQACIEFLDDVKQEKVFMIVSGALGYHVVPKIKSLPQMEYIYVFCRDRAANESWTKNIAKIRGVYTEIDPLCDALRIDRRNCDRNMISIRINRIDPLFVYSQLVKDAILQIKDDDAAHIKKLTDFCQQQGDIDAWYINKVRTEYRQHTPVWWYTGNTFMYSVLNRGLREMNRDIILSMQFFIRHLHQHIAELCANQTKSTSSNIKGRFTVYRGQGLRTEVFEQLKQSRGELMSFNNFLSTSVDRKVSWNLARQNSGQMVGVIFVMSIDSRISETSDIPYANIHKIGFDQCDENDILFTTHTVFRINNLQRLAGSESDNLWEVQLTLVGKDDSELKQVMEHAKGEISGDGLQRLSCILLKMEEPGKVGTRYETLLARATTDRERATYLGQLGSVYRDTGEYSKAAEFYERCVDIYKKILPPSDPNFADSYNILGSVYMAMHDYPKALESYQTALELRKIVLPSNHPDLAMSYNIIGEVYTQMIKFPNAFESYQKSLEIRKTAFPANHPDLAVSYSNIGEIYVQVAEYSKALELHQKALEIRSEILPPNHPDLIASYNNIGKVYVHMNEYPKALELHQKSLEIRKTTLTQNHPDLAQSYNNLGEVYARMGEHSKALELYQKSLEIRKTTLPENHPDLAQSYNNLGEVYSQIAEYSKAFELHQKSLEIRKISLPSNHPDLAQSYNNIGNEFAQMGEYSKALESHKASLDIRDEVLPSNHPILAATYNNIGVVCEILKDYGAAVLCYKKALEIWSDSLPEDHPYVVAMTENVDRLVKGIASHILLSSLANLFK